mgnify:CR=1 FL=1
MRIELEDENKKKQQEEHTCQQLSQKHESDLTKKEKRLLEKEKLKVMDWKGKLQYIWMYYKVWIFAAIGIVFLAFGIRSWIENARIKTFLSIAVVDSAGADYETVQENLKELSGIDQDPYQKVDITETLVSNEDGTQLDTYSQVAFVTKVQAQAFDVVLMPETLCSSFEKEGYFFHTITFPSSITYGRTSCTGSFLCQFLSCKMRMTSRIYFAISALQTSPFP